MRRGCSLLVLVIAVLFPLGQALCSNQAVIIQAYKPEEGSFLDPWKNTVFWCDPYLVWEMLDTNLYGRRTTMQELPPERIHMLYGMGSDWQNRYLYPRYDPRVLYNNPGFTITEAPADTHHIHALFAVLADSMGSGDTLFVYTFGHGGSDMRSGHSAFADHSCLLVRLNDSTNPQYNPYRLWDTTFAAWLDNVHAGKKVVVLAQCFSGGFVDDLVGGVQGTQYLTLDSSSGVW